MNNPKISVIIPVYNVYESLSECLKSVIHQTFSDFEIICINDASTDDSLNILEKYSLEDNRIRIVNHEKNKGLSFARNTGIENAVGEYLFFLDSDDWIASDSLLKMYNAICGSQADIVVSKTKIFLDGGVGKNLDHQKVLDTMNRYLNSFSEGVVKVPLDEIYYQKIPGVAWGKLYKKAFVDNNRLRFINKRIMHEDEGFWLKCLLHCPLLCCINDVSVMYRIRFDSIMFKSSFKVNEKDLIVSYIDAITHIKDFSEEYFNNITSSINFFLNKKRIPLKVGQSDLSLYVDEGEKAKYGLLSKFCFWGKRSAYAKRLQKLEKNIDAVKRIFDGEKSICI